MRGNTVSFQADLGVNFSTSSQDFTVAVESFNFGVGIPVTTATGTGGGGAAKPSFSPLAINKMQDVNTIVLFNAAVAVRAIPKVTLTLTKTGSTTPDLTYTLTNAFITEIIDSGNGHGGPFPTEQITFVFEKIQIISGGNEFGYDVRTATTF